MVGFFSKKSVDKSIKINIKSDDCLWNVVILNVGFMSLRELKFL